jgi:hypothetical protein
LTLLPGKQADSMPEVFPDGLDKAACTNRI